MAAGLVYVHPIGLRLTLLRIQENDGGFVIDADEFYAGQERHKRWGRWLGDGERGRRRSGGRRWKRRNGQMVGVMINAQV
jgi:hypothetical protein